MGNLQSTPDGYLLNMQTLVDEMQAQGLPLSFVNADDRPCLKGMQFYFGQELLFVDSVYLCTFDTLIKRPFSLENGFLIILGDNKGWNVPLGCTYLIVHKAESLYQIANIVQQVFTNYFMWCRKIQNVLDHGGYINKLAQLASEYFENPVLIHDENFNILACPKWIDKMPTFSINKQTGDWITNVDTLNYFCTNKFYKETLKTTGSQIWVSELGDRSIYVNIWDSDVYRGRFLIFENDTPLKPGQMLMAEYFISSIKLSLVQMNDRNNENRQFLEEIFARHNDGSKMNEQILYHGLRGLEWNEADEFICGIISFEDEEITQFSLYGICNDIEQKIKGSLLYYDHNRLYLLVNLSYGNCDVLQLRMQMAFMIREALLHVTMSLPFSGIQQLPVYLKQAEIALQYTLKEESTSWFNTFDSYVLDYWMKHGIGELTSSSICSRALQVLKEYDKLHETQLYETLEVYLITERNSTLTSQILKIHRSTLPHRLERINQLIHIDLNVFEKRLYLYMSLYFSKTNNRLT